MKTLVLCFILVAGGIWLGWTRHEQIVALRRAQAELQNSAVEMEECKQVKARAVRTMVESNELVLLREEHSDLMKLRSELGRLRQVARLDLPQLQERATATEKEAAQEDRRGPDLQDERAAALQSSLVWECLKYSLLNSLIRLAKANDGKFPGSFTEAESMLEAIPERERTMVRMALTRTNSIDPTEARLIGRSCNVSAGDFQFVASAAQLSVNSPPAILLREAASRQLPDGQFARWFGFTDGQTVELKSRDGTFSDPAPPTTPGQ